MCFDLACCPAAVYTLTAGAAVFSFLCARRTCWKLLLTTGLLEGTLTASPEQ